jgi:glucose-1-phosphate cytidylyltransferase
MKVVILAGGRGTRLAEETHSIPKPMVNIGGRPILWHIMTHYAQHGYDDFIVALGYKGYVIKEYFVNYFMHESDLRVDLGSGATELLGHPTENWRVTLVDTGLETMTGGRLHRLAPFLDDTFMLTYGDGVSDVNLDALLKRHRESGALATVTSVHPPPRFGSLEVRNGMVAQFREKPVDGQDRINGGFFVVEPPVLDLLKGDDSIFEREPLARLADQGQLASYEHNGFWMPMDTLRDRDELNALWNRGHAPWVRS